MCLNRTPKCQVCKAQDAEYAWQPCGPDDNPRKCFPLLGEHYRGFQVVKICDNCRKLIKAGATAKWHYLGTTWWIEGDRVANLSMCPYH